MIWELIVGLETHVELATKSKIFCSCSTEFGGEPNSHCCPICTGHPGTLPSLNRRAVEYSVMAGLALNCDINKISKFDRKHYVYPDLPKAFQVSQYDVPLCLKGYIDLSNGRRINISHVHLEEDTGKMIHEDGKVLIDYNRAGVPLIEIVTGPDFRSTMEAVEYLEKLQSLLRTVGVSVCRMQEGSMRCDVNISVRELGSTHFGTRTEIKNLNSFTSIQAAIKSEFKRQVELLESNRPILQKTLSFNAATGETLNMRDKEDADNYRYFREPDMTSMLLDEENIIKLRENIPELPDSRIKRYVTDYGLPQEDAVLLCKYRKVSDFFDRATEGLKYPSVAASFILTQMFAFISTEPAREKWDTPIPPEYLRRLILLLEEGKINRNLSKVVFSKMLEKGKDPESIMESEGISTVDLVPVEELCQRAIDSHPNAVEDYINGKEKALQALIGSVMRQSKGRADGQETKESIIKLLQK